MLRLRLDNDANTVADGSSPPGVGVFRRDANQNATSASAAYDTLEWTLLSWLATEINIRGGRALELYR